MNLVKILDSKHHLIILGKNLNFLLKKKMQLNCFDCCTITMTDHKLREHMASRVSSQKAQSWKAIKAKKKTIRNPETINPCDTYLFVGSGLHIVGSNFWANSLNTSKKAVEEMWYSWRNIMILYISQNILLKMESV